MSHPIEVANINGIQIVKAGNTGPNIIFIHDTGQPPVGMERQIKRLAEVGTVYAPNLYDITGALARKHIKPTFADIVHEFNTLDLIGKNDRIGIVAASLGAGFAWQYAADNPQQVDWITAASPLGWPLDRSMFDWLKIGWQMNQEVSKYPKEVKKRDPGLAQFFKQIRKDPVGVLAGLKLMMNFDSRPQMSEIQSPVDLLFGNDTICTPVWTGQNMMSLMPNARLEVVSQYNHFWYQFEPEKWTSPATQRVKSGLS